MRTVVAAALLFALAFGGTYFVMHTAPQSPEEAAAQSTVKDAFLSVLGQQPEPETAPEEPLSEREAYRNLQSAYLKLNSTCSAESRKRYGTAFAQFVEARERANEAGKHYGFEPDQMAILNQFMYLAAYHVIEADDMPSRRFRRMVASTARSHDNPTERERELRERMGLDWYRNDAGEVMQPTRCKPLTEEG